MRLIDKLVGLQLINTWKIKVNQFIISKLQYCADLIMIIRSLSSQFVQLLICLATSITSSSFSFCSHLGGSRRAISLNSLSDIEGGLLYVICPQKYSTLLAEGQLHFWQLDVPFKVPLSCYQWILLRFLCVLRVNQVTFYFLPEHCSFINVFHFSNSLGIPY